MSFRSENALVVAALFLFCTAAQEGKEPTVATTVDELTDETMMPTIASHKVYVALFHKASTKSNADKAVAGDGKGGDMRKEMDEVAGLSKGAYGVGVVDVEQFPILAKIYKIETFPMVKALIRPAATKRGYGSQPPFDLYLGFPHRQARRLLWSPTCPDHERIPQNDA